MSVQEEVWEILRKLALSSEETDRRMQATDLQMKETDRRMQETDLQMKETDRKLKEVTKAIGRLGNRLG